MKLLIKYTEKINKFFKFETEVKWMNAVIIFSYHLAAVYWCYHYCFPAKWQSLIFAVFMNYASGLGVSIGAHRYWTHHSFKATKPLQIMMLAMFTSAGQNSVRQWVRDHRVHHKYTDTQADPHNARRGLFFSHIGWLMMKKDSEVIKRGKQVDLSDIDSDLLLQWHERNFPFLKLLLCFVLPTLTGVVLWREDWHCAVAWQCFARYLFSFHSTLTINSIAHAFGYRPYNKHIKPVESWFAEIMTVGDGCHNFHHAFPYDYASAEFLGFSQLSTHLINLWAWLGLAYDLRVATPETIKATAKRIGDGSYVEKDLHHKKM